MKHAQRQFWLLQLPWSLGVATATYGVLRQQHPDARAVKAFAQTVAARQAALGALEHATDAVVGGHPQQARTFSGLLGLASQVRQGASLADVRRSLHALHQTPGAGLTQATRRALQQYTQAVHNLYTQRSQLTALANIPWVASLAGLPPEAARRMAAGNPSRFLTALFQRSLTDARLHPDFFKQMTKDLTHMAHLKATLWAASVGLGLAGFFETLAWLRARNGGHTAEGAR
jgi:hypothetical protein